MARSATSWVKGQSGNPGGRPKQIGEVRDLAREHTEEAIGTLVGIMQDEGAPASARLQAAQAILDRGWGRPSQAVEVDSRSHLTLVDLIEGADWEDEPVLAV